MCEPATAIAALALAMSAASAVSSQTAQADYQSAQSSEASRVAKWNAEQAIKEQNEQSAAERINQMQQEQSGSEQIQQNQQEKLEKMGTAIASSEGAGRSMEYLMADFERANAQRTDVVRQQLEMSGINSDIAVSSYKDRAHNRINGQGRFIGQTPNYLGTALQIGSSAISTYSTFSDNGKNDLWGIKAWNKSKSAG